MNKSILFLTFEVVNLINQILLCLIIFLGRNVTLSLKINFDIFSFCRIGLVLIISNSSVAHLFLNFLAMLSYVKSSFWLQLSRDIIKVGWRNLFLPFLWKRNSSRVHNRNCFFIHEFPVISSIFRLCTTIVEYHWRW